MRHQTCRVFAKMARQLCSRQDKTSPKGSSDALPFPLSHRSRASFGFRQVLSYTQAVVALNQNLPPAAALVVDSLPRQSQEQTLRFAFQVSLVSANPSELLFPGSEAKALCPIPGIPCPISQQGSV